MYLVILFVSFVPFVVQKQRPKCLLWFLGFRYTHSAKP